MFLTLGQILLMCVGIRHKLNSDTSGIYTDIYSDKQFQNIRSTFNVLSSMSGLLVRQPPFRLVRIACMGNYFIDKYDIMQGWPSQETEAVAAGGLTIICLLPLASATPPLLGVGQPAYVNHHEYI